MQKRITKKTAIYLAITFVAISLILSFTYRTYIYQNHIYDFHFADTIGNIFAVPAATLFLTGIRKKPTEIIKIIPIIVLIYILYEFMGLISLHGTFDIYDIIATIISGGITFIILNCLRIKEL